MLSLCRLCAPPRSWQFAAKRTLACENFDVMAAEHQTAAGDRTLRDVSRLMRAACRAEGRPASDPTPEMYLEATRRVREGPSARRRRRQRLGVLGACLAAAAGMAIVLDVGLLPGSTRMPAASGGATVPSATGSQRPGTDPRGRPAAGNRAGPAPAAPQPGTSPATGGAAPGTSRGARGTPSQRSAASPQHSDAASSASPSAKQTDRPTPSPDPSPSPSPTCVTVLIIPVCQ